MLTRRTATVTISAPDTSMSACASRKSLYFPVPTMRRDLKVFPASLNRSSITFPLSATDKVDDFNFVAVFQRRGRKGIARQHIAIQLHDHSGRTNLQLFKKLGDAQAGFDLSLFAVYVNNHRCQNKKTVSDAVTSGNTVLAALCLIKVRQAPRASLRRYYPDQVQRVTQEGFLEFSVRPTNTPSSRGKLTNALG